MELFIYDEKTGELIITDLAKDFYKGQGLDPQQMADEWLKKVLNTKIVEK